MLLIQVLSHVPEIRSEGIPLAHYNNTWSTNEDKWLNIDWFLKIITIVLISICYKP